jgi:hypothetical protein
MWSATVFSTVALILYRALSIERERSMNALDRRSEVLSSLAIFHHRFVTKSDSRLWSWKPGIPLSSVW